MNEKDYLPPVIVVRDDAPLISTLASTIAESTSVDSRIAVVEAGFGQQGVFVVRIEVRV